MTDSGPAPSPTPPEPPSASQNVFFRANRSFRSPKAIVSIVLMAGVSAYVWWLYFLPPGKNTASNDLPFFIAMILTFMTLAGSRRILKGEQMSLVISEEGVQYGTDFWGWGQITRIGLARISFSKHQWPKITLADSGRLVILAVDQPLTPEAGAKFLYSLQPWLQQHYPHVQFG